MHSERDFCFQMLMGQAEDLLNDNLKQDMCDVLGSVCLGPIMANEVMFQYETSNFFVELLS